MPPATGAAVSEPTAWRWLAGEERSAMHDSVNSLLDLDNSGGALLLDRLLQVLQMMRPLNCRFTACTGRMDYQLPGTSLTDTNAYYPGGYDIYHMLQPVTANNPCVTSPPGVRAQRQRPHCNLYCLPSRCPAKQAEGPHLP